MGAFGVVDRLVYGEWAIKAGDKITQGLNFLMFATGLLLFWRASRRGSILAGGTLALALAAFLLLSALWSIDPQTTIRRGVLYVFFVIGVIGVAGNLDGDKFMDLLGVTCLLAAAASIVLLVISPRNALEMSGSNELRGIFANKNALGPVMAAGALASLHGIRIGGGRRLPNIFTLIVFIVVAFAAKSTTSLLIIFAFCTADRVVALFRRARILAMLFDYIVGSNCRDRCTESQFVSGNDRKGSDLDWAHRFVGLFNPLHLRKANAGVGLLCVLVRRQSRRERDLLTFGMARCTRT